MWKRFFAGSSTPLGDREIGVILCTSELGRDGHILEPSGVSLRNYSRNPIALWQHNPEQPIGAVHSAGLTPDGNLAGIVTFAPAGISLKADEIAALAKAGIVRGVSIGYDVIEWAPLDPREPRGGQRVTRSELLEVSLVSIPADTGALVAQRSARSRLDARIFRTLPLMPGEPLPRAPILGSTPDWHQHFARHARAVMTAGLPDHDFEERQNQLRRFRERAP
jgi:HK97 family phage prohead protease